jgi:hypothetical protein
MTLTNSADLMSSLRGVRDLAVIRGLADRVVEEAPADDRDMLMIAGSLVNPLFVPTQQHGPALNAAQWIYHLAQARMTAANSASRRILVAAPLKTASTFVSQSLADGLGLSKSCLAMLLARPYDFVLQEAGLAAFRIDELALITACLSPRGFVAHHHMVASPYLARQLETYNVQPVLIRRNVFDCLVSLDGFFMKNRELMQIDGRIYFNNGMTFDWHAQDFETRIAIILDRYLQFYVDYHVSWSECTRRGLTDPLVISYEDDILKGREHLARRLGDRLALSRGEIAGMADAMDNDAMPEGGLFNKGVAGRGVAISGSNRQRVLDAFEDYRGVADLDGLLD